MEDSVDLTKVIKYFRSNIFEAYTAYTAWKTIAYSKSRAIVSSEMAERYVEIQNYHKEFFVTSERAFLVQFVLMVLHPLDLMEKEEKVFRKDDPNHIFYIMLPAGHRILEPWQKRAWYFVMYDKHNLFVVLSVLVSIFSLGISILALWSSNNVQ